MSEDPTAELPPPPREDTELTASRSGKVLSNRTIAVCAAAVVVLAGVAGCCSVCTARVLLADQAHLDAIRTVGTIVLDAGGAIALFVRLPWIAGFIRRTAHRMARMVLGEAALHVQVGGPDVMREQVQHLLKVCELLNVSIRILPFSAGAHRALGVGFYVVKVESPAAITRVYMEGLANGTYIHEPDEVDVYGTTFARLWDMAASDQDSATILHRRIT